jgi:hypothetical protein
MTPPQSVMTPRKAPDGLFGWRSPGSSTSSSLDEAGELPVQAGLRSGARPGSCPFNPIIPIDFIGIDLHDEDMAALLTSRRYLDLRRQASAICR